MEPKSPARIKEVVFRKEALQLDLRHEIINCFKLRLRANYFKIVWCNFVVVELTNRIRRRGSKLDWIKLIFDIVSGKIVSRIFIINLTDAGLFTRLCFCHQNTD